MSAVDEFLTDPRSLQVPWFESPLFGAQVQKVAAPDAWKREAREFREQGYVILEDVVPPDLIDAIVAEYPWLFDPATRFDVPPHVQELLHRDPSRRQDAWMVSASMKRLACLPQLLERLRFYFQREPIPFQTLNFLPGTQQPAHSDSIHFSSIPYGFMCGAWVALEDVDEDNGPLIYYPGSHRLTEVRLEHLGRLAEEKDVAAGPNYARFEDYVRSVVHALKLEPKRFCARKGSVVIWAANLLHGGDAIRDPRRTRKSQVTHYYFEGCVYYSPITSNVPFGELKLKHVHDIARDRTVPHTVNGIPVATTPLGGGRFRVSRPGVDGVQRDADQGIAARRIDKWMRRLGLRRDGVPGYT